MRKIIAVLPIISLLLLLSCSSHKGRVLGKNEMEDVLYDMQLAQALYNDYNLKLSKPEQKDSLINDVLYKHNITQADLDTSLIWYSDNIDEYNKINESVVTRLKIKRDNLRTQIISREEKDKYDIMPSSYTLEYTSPAFTFDIDSTKLKQIELPSFSWHFDVLGISPKDSVEASVLFVYADSTVQKTQQLDENKMYTFSKPEIQDSLLQNISGYIRLVNNRINTRIILYNMDYLDLTLSTPKKQDTSESEENSLKATEPELTTEK